MKVLFLKNVKGVARVGDIKDVSDGYARNFLLPGKVAKAATVATAKEAQAMKQKVALAETKNKAAAEEIANRLAGSVLEISEGANAEGHLYGSIDAKKIAKAIGKQFNINLSEEQISLPQHLKTTGEHQVKLELFQDTATTLTVRVLPS